MSERPASGLAGSHLLLWRAACGLYAVGVFTGTHLPKSVAEALTPSGPMSSDKLQHFSAYVGLGFLLAAVWHAGQRPVWRNVALGLACLATFAAFDEVSQGWPGLGREPDVLDFVADMLGGSIGWGIYLALRGRLGVEAGGDQIADAK